MKKYEKGVTFRFDESVLLENRSLQLPLNIVSSEYNIIHTLQKELIKFKSNFSSNKASNNIDLDENSVIDSNLLNRLNSQSSSFNSNNNNLFSSNDNNDSSRDSKNIYSMLLDETLNELNRIDELKRQEQIKKEKELELEKQLKLQKEMEIQKEKLELENKLKLERELENKKKLELESSLSGDNNYIPKNDSVNIFNTMNQKFMEYENIYNQVNNNNELKSARIEIIKKLNVCINSISNTRKQIELTLNTVVTLLNTYSNRNNMNNNTNSNMGLLNNMNSNTNNTSTTTSNSSNSTTTSNNMDVYIIYRLVNGIINCCEEGNQIYINNKSAWSYANLLYNLSSYLTNNNMNNNTNSNMGLLNNMNSNTNNTSTTTSNNRENNIVYVMLLQLLCRKCVLIIPRFYLNSNTNNTSTSNSNMGLLNNMNTTNNTSTTSSNQLSMSELEQLGNKHDYVIDNKRDIVYNKKLQSYLTLYLTFLIVNNDFKLIWAFYANVINSSWHNIFTPIIPCILITTLNITSYFMLTVYKNQFQKVLANIFDLLNSKLVNFGLTSSIKMYIGQIQQFYQSYNSKGVLNEPEGYTMKYKEEELRDDI